MFIKGSESLKELQKKAIVLIENHAKMSYETISELQPFLT